MYVKTEGGGMDDIKKAIQFLLHHRVLVGIPEGSGGGSGGMSNVALAYLHSNGSPVNNIPARPFLEPAIDEAMDDIAEQMNNAANYALAGQFDMATNALGYAGTYGRDAAKEYIGSGHLAANAPITINGGWMRNKVSGKPVYVKGKGSSAPLINTSSLQGSITYIVESE